MSKQTRLNIGPRLAQTGENHDGPKRISSHRIGGSNRRRSPGLLEFHYRVLVYEERGYDEIPYTGFSSDYVYRETKRARAGLEGAKAQLWPGIDIDDVPTDIDVPTQENHSKSTPYGTRDAFAAAFRGGADGVLISRKYSEMKLDNLKAVGDAIQHLK